MLSVTDIYDINNERTNKKKVERKIIPKEKINNIRMRPFLVSYFPLITIYRDLYRIFWNREIVDNNANFLFWG